MSDCITGSQFEIIANAKQALLDSTNIDTSPNEMACLDSFLFRCWQMGWLDKYEKDLVEVVRCKDCKYWVEEGNEAFGHAKFCNHDCSLGGQGVKKPTDFCNYGERQEQEHE